jgi:DNA polymerase III subunit gamma/tau
MSYTVLARKYRPQTFSEVIGQDHVTRTLRNAIEQQRIAHGYIFSGHRGIGKTTIARILAMALNCRKGEKPTPEPCGKCESCTEVRTGTSVDVIEIDAATNRGIDEIRELREATRYRPARDRYKIYILDEAHQITDAAFNALLKTLEEPPSHIVFMMATTQPEDIPQTIRSRCQHFSFHAVKFDDIVGQLKDIAKQEKIGVEDDAIAVLAEAGDGSMRDALSIMDQAIASTGKNEKLTAALVRGLVGNVSTEVLESLMGSVARNSSEEVLQLIDKLVTEGQSPMHFIRQLVRFLRNATVARVAGAESSLLQISSDERQRVARVAAQFGEEDLTRFLQIALRTHDELGYKSEQRFHLELGILKMVHAQRLLPLEQILSEQPVSAQASAPQHSAPRPQAAAPMRTSSESSPFGRGGGASPFEADRVRKGRGPEMSSGAAAQAAADSVAMVKAVATATVLAAVESMAEAKPEPLVNSGTADIAEIRTAVLDTLESDQQEMLAHFLDTPEWSLDGNEITIKVAKSQMMIDMSFGVEAKKMVIAAASKAASRPLKVRVLPGGTVSTPAAPHRSTSRPNVSGSARSRAADDPLVQYMQKKFGGEIRTVIDRQNPDRNPDRSND